MKFLLAITLALALASSEQSFLASQAQIGNPLVIASDSTTWVVGPQSPKRAPATLVQHSWTAKIPGANWIFDGTQSVAGTSNFFKNFNILDTPSKATLEFAADDLCKIFINGVNAGLDTTNGSWDINSQKSADVTAFLKVGENDLRVELTNISGAGGLLYKLTIS